MMHRILYVSELADSPSSVAEIVRSARINNARDEITGLLCFDGAWFAQWVEGDDAAVRDCYARIVADPRHRAVRCLADTPVDQRSFADFAMGFLTTDDGCPTLSDAFADPDMTPEQACDRFLSVAVRADVG